MTDFSVIGSAQTDSMRIGQIPSRHDPRFRDVRVSAINSGVDNADSDEEPAKTKTVQSVRPDVRYGLIQSQRAEHGRFDRGHTGHRANSQKFSKRQLYLQRSRLRGKLRRNESPGAVGYHDGRAPAKQVGGLVSQSLYGTDCGLNVVKIGLRLDVQGDVKDRIQTHFVTEYAALCFADSASESWSKLTVNGRQRVQYLASFSIHEPSVGRKCKRLMIDHCGNVLLPEIDFHQRIRVASHFARNAHLCDDVYWGHTVTSTQVPDGCLCSPVLPHQFVFERIDLLPGRGAAQGTQDGCDQCEKS
jgi:hypothetical protein